MTNLRTPVLLTIFLLAVATLGLAACGPGSSPEAPRAEIALENLPREARHTLELIRKDGPFPYSRDGTVFGNRERLLPAQERGYYREYTVVTQGSRDRGARRIVAGAGGETYYTDDHYDSFRRIRE